MRDGLKSWLHLRWWRLNETSPDFFARVNHAMGKGPLVLPPPERLFEAFELTPFDKVKVVILGQDPYPTKGHAHGLAFSVLPHVKPLPASLRNIFKEYVADLGYETPRTGDLRPWAERGVLLLNTVLTVEEGKPNSHKEIGWEKLTYEVIRSLSERGKVCFVLWGQQAQEYKAACHDCPVVCSSHPSPLSFTRGFQGSKPFSKINQHLKNMNVEPIDWRLR